MFFVKYFIYIKYFGRLMVYNCMNEFFDIFVFFCYFSYMFLCRVSSYKGIWVCVRVVDLSFFRYFLG